MDRMIEKYTYYTFLAILTTAAMFFTPIEVQAQNKQIAQAKEKIKAKKDVAQAENSMRVLLADSAYATNEKVWLTMIAAENTIYDMGNENLYLKQQIDTTAWLQATMRLFQDMERFDSIDALPDKKGRVQPKHREKHTERLNTIRPNLYFGGTYFLAKGNYSESLRFYNKYIDCDTIAMLRKYKYSEKDSIMIQAAYWAMYAATKCGEYKKALTYREMAERDSTHLNFILQYISECYSQMKDTENYVNTLREGFTRYPSFPFFYPRLIEYYQNCNMNDSAMAVTDKALKTDSTNINFMLTKSTLLLNRGDYAESLYYCYNILQKDSTVADTYYNIGLIYFNQAIEIDKVRQTSAAKKRQMENLYRQSLPYLEKYRAMAPEKKQRWMSPLYTIYLNLNMGKEFDEIDKLINEYRRNNK